MIDEGFSESNIVKLFSKIIEEDDNTDRDIEKYAYLIYYLLDHYHNDEKEYLQKKFPFGNEEV